MTTALMWLRIWLWVSRSNSSSSRRSCRVRRVVLFLSFSSSTITAVAQVERLRVFGHHLGLAFQYEDDLLDGDSPFSREETTCRVRNHTAASIAALEGLPGDCAFLSSLAKRLVGRTV